MVAISIIIPCYNEGARLPDTIKLLREFKSRHKIEIVFVNDGSTDNTLEVLKKSGFGYRTYTKNQGKGYAVREGLLHSRYAVKLVLDADLSIMPTYLKDIDFKADWDVIKGKRRYVTMPIHRRVLSWGFHKYIQWHTDLQFDTQSPFMLLRLPQEFYKGLYVNGFCFDIEILLKARREGYTIRELYVAYLYSRGSKVTVRKTMKMLQEIAVIK